MNKQPKLYSSKSNAQRAARLLDVATVEQIDGKWAVVTYEHTDDEVPAKQIDVAAPPQADRADARSEAATTEDLVRFKSFSTQKRAEMAAAKLPGALAQYVENVWVVFAPPANVAKSARSSGRPPAPVGDRLAKVIELARRPGGTTRKELDSVVGGPAHAPWTQTLQRAARRSGLRLAIVKDGRTAGYCLRA